MTQDDGELRDIFALGALVALAGRLPDAHVENAKSRTKKEAQEISRTAYELADAMVAERAKRAST